MNRLRRFISAITFIGVIFHEFGHKFFCELTGVKVHRVCYFRIGNPAGYVVHERPRSFVQSFLIAVGPLVTGTGFALLFFYIANEQSTTWQQLFFIWLGGSVAVNSFPSNTDAKSLLQDTNRHIGKNFLAAVGYPFALLIWLANTLNIFFIDIIYALLLYYWLNQVLV